MAGASGGWNSSGPIEPLATSGRGNVESHSVAGLMNKSKYSHNVLRTGDLPENTPFTLLRSERNTVIQLPLPLNLSSSISPDWQQGQVSVLNHALRHSNGSVDSVMDALKNPGTTAGNAFSAMWNGKVSNIDIISDVRAMMARSKEAGTNTGGVRVALNPRNEMMFNGMNFKSYQFQFMLVPYNKEDSESIAKAILEIQRACVPSLAGYKMIMEYPDSWRIYFMDGSNYADDYIMTINECVCTNIGINYTPNAQSNQMHEQNAPLAVELTLDFTEINISTKENIDKYNG